MKTSIKEITDFYSKEIVENKYHYIWLLLALLVKVFYFFTHQSLMGPDAIEYYAASKVFTEKGFWGYLSDPSYYTLWRLPLYPLIIAVCQSFTVLFIFQNIVALLIPFFVFKIFYKLNQNKTLSIKIALLSLFVPYLNISTEGIGVELWHLLFLVYIAKKILYNEMDARLALAIAALCLLRAEGFIVLGFVMLKILIHKQFKPLLWMLIPILVIASWQYRNLKVFGTYSMVNPILSSRALIGSIYGAIYVDNVHPFHKEWDYYQGMDYVRQKEFVAAYKNKVKEELMAYVSEHPWEFIKHRLYWIFKCFSYISFNHERLPDKNWVYDSSRTYEQVLAVNQQWAYRNLLAEKDYFRLFLRLSYNLGLATAHLLGLVFLLIKFRRNWWLIYLLGTFGFVLVVEVDMRYLIYPQFICFLLFFEFLFAWLGKRKKALIE